MQAHINMHQARGDATVRRQPFSVPLWKATLIKRHSIWLLLLSFALCSNACLQFPKNVVNRYFWAVRPTLWNSRVFPNGKSTGSTDAQSLFAGPEDVVYSKAWTGFVEDDSFRWKALKVSNLKFVPGETIVILRNDKCMRGGKKSRNKKFDATLDLIATPAESTDWSFTRRRFFKCTCLVRLLAQKEFATIHCNQGPGMSTTRLYIPKLNGFQPPSIEGELGAFYRRFPRATPALAASPKALDASGAAGGSSMAPPPEGIQGPESASAPLQQHSTRKVPREYLPLSSPTDAGSASSEPLQQPEAQVSAASSAAHSPSVQQQKAAAFAPLQPDVEEPGSTALLPTTVEDAASALLPPPGTPAPGLGPSAPSAASGKAKNRRRRHRQKKPSSATVLDQNCPLQE